MIAFKAGPHWAAAYAAPLLASIMQPVHATGEPCSVTGAVLVSDGLRHVLDPRTVRNLGPVKLPFVPPMARVGFAVICARSVCDGPTFVEWADAWVAGVDRRPATALAALVPVPPCDRAYVAHWAKMSAAFPHDPTLPAQTAALLAALVCPKGTFDFESRARAAVDIAV